MKTETDLQADIGEVLLTEAQIQSRIVELGAQISIDYAGRALTLVSVLKGSHHDLVRLQFRPRDRGGTKNNQRRGNSKRTHRASLRNKWQQPTQRRP